MTPFLGILVKAGTFVQVLYRFSPLQNIEAGYTALLSGGTVGLTTLLGLILATVAVFGASLFLRPLTNETVVKTMMKIKNICVCLGACLIFLGGLAVTATADDGNLELNEQMIYDDGYKDDTLQNYGVKTLFSPRWKVKIKAKSKLVLP